LSGFSGGGQEVRGGQGRSSWIKNLKIIGYFPFPENKVPKNILKLMEMS
jgi:hypothetical protein